MTPWDAGSALYRKLLLTALAVTGLGIVLSIVGMGLRSQPLSIIAIVIIVSGLLTHVAGLLVRGRDSRRRSMEYRKKQGL